MGRLIDADKLKERLREKIYSFIKKRGVGINDLFDYERGRVDEIENCILMISDAPTVDVPTWIPCSERLPNNDEEVIVSVEDDRADNTFKYTTTAWRYGDVWVSDNERICGIIAWMPLPKPYEETDHE